MADTKPNRSTRLEGVAQVLILLTIGVTAAAASFTHVHNVAVAHGQPGWLAWADAVVLELMSIGTGLEIRRRHRTCQSAGFVLWVLGAGVALSLSAQVVEAERSVVGWLAAALPALGFLASVKIVLARTPATESADTGPAQARPVAAPAPTRVRVDSAAVIVPERSSHEPILMSDALGALTADQVQAVAVEPPSHARKEASEHAAESRNDTDRRGQARSDRPGTVPVPPGSFTRVNGATITSGGVK